VHVGGRRPSEGFDGDVLTLRAIEAGDDDGVPRVAETRHARAGVAPLVASGLGRVNAMSHQRQVFACTRANPRGVLGPVQGEHQVRIGHDTARPKKHPERCPEIDHSLRPRRCVTVDHGGIGPYWAMQGHGIGDSTRSRDRANDPAKPSQRVQMDHIGARRSHQLPRLFDAQEISTGGHESRPPLRCESEVRIMCAKRLEPGADFTKGCVVRARFARRVHFACPAEARQLGNESDQVCLYPSPLAWLELSENVNDVRHWLQKRIVGPSPEA
jgi:hypothetical protein